MACLEFDPTTPAQPHGLPQHGAPKADQGEVRWDQPIENYGIIGSMRTAALVGMNGSTDLVLLPEL